MLEKWLCLITNYWPGTETETYSEHGQTFKMESTSIKISSKTPAKEAPQGNILEFFSKILLKLHFEWKISARDGHNLRLSLQKWGHFSIFKNGRGGLPSPRPPFPQPPPPRPSCTAVSVSEYASISLNMP